VANLLIASLSVNQTHCVLLLRSQTGCKERIEISKPLTAILAEKMLVASVVAHPHEPDSGDELSHGFVRGKETHDDHLD